MHSSNLTTTTRSDLSTGEGGGGGGGKPRQSFNMRICQGSLLGTDDNRSTEFAVTIVGACRLLRSKDTQQRVERGGRNNIIISALKSPEILSVCLRRPVQSRAVN